MDIKKLYCYKPNGKYYVWIGSIEVNKNNNVFIVTSNGYEGSKMTQHKKEIMEGKQKRSILEQAKMVLHRKYRNKIDKENYTTQKNNPVELDNHDFDFNRFRPMLAQNANEKTLDKLQFNDICIQPKLDGFRCIIFWCPKTQQVILMTRTGKYINFFNHIREDMQRFFMENKYNKNYILDGEIYSNTISFQNIVGFTHKKELTKDDVNIISKINYHVFDIFDNKNKDISFENRFQVILKYLNDNDTISIIPVLCYKIKNKEELKCQFKQFIENNYEGLMIRMLDKHYDIKKRSKFLLKYKEFQDDEFIIIGGKEADGNDKGTVIFECETQTNLKFHVRPMGTREERKKYFDNLDDYIGLKLTVQFQEYTDAGIPRFPVGKAIRDGY